MQWFINCFFFRFSVNIWVSEITRPERIWSWDCDLCCSGNSTWSTSMSSMAVWCIIYENSGQPGVILMLLVLVYSILFLRASISAQVCCSCVRIIHWFTVRDHFQLKINQSDPCIPLMALYSGLPVCTLHDHANCRRCPFDFLSRSFRFSFYSFTDRHSTSYMS